MPHPTIFIIRHGEKPTKGERGITADGKHSKHSLIARGWQRAGGLVSLFGAAAHATAKAPLATPTAIFAASPDAPGVDKKEKSRREEETATPLAHRLGVKLNLNFGKGTEKKLTEAVRKAAGPVLIVWEHEMIVSLTRELCSSSTIPVMWPSDRFDVVFVLTPDGDGYSFSQVPQQLLVGDLGEGLPDRQA